MASKTIDEAFAGEQLLKRYTSEPSTIFALLDTLRYTKDVFIVAKAEVRCHPHPLNISILMSMTNCDPAVAALSSSVVP